MLGPTPEAPRGWPAPGWGGGDVTSDQVLDVLCKQSQQEFLRNQVYSIPKG